MRWAWKSSVRAGQCFPAFRPLVYDPRITEGHIGVALQVDESLAPHVEQVLKANGAHHFKRMAVAPRHDRGFRVFWAAVVVLLVVLSAAVLLPAYDIVRIPIPTNMAEQDVVAYDQGPRIAPPAGAVPVQGVALVGGQVVSTPAPSGTQSLQYGQVLYDQHCALCHGQDGKGAGPLAHYFQPSRVSLVGGTAITLSDAQIFTILTQGRGQMPALAEDLTQAERWDVIDYLHTLRR
jgi:mono/diheme cytochrome c family protein